MFGSWFAILGIVMIAGLFWWAVGALPIIPAPLGQILRVFIVLIAGCWLISTLFLHGGSFGWGHGIGAGVHIN
jgi:hypothetical protein